MHGKFKIGIQLSEKIVEEAVIDALKEKLEATHILILFENLESTDILITDDKKLNNRFKTNLNFLITSDLASQTSAHHIYLKKPFKIELLVRPIQNLMKQQEVIYIANSQIVFSNMMKRMNDPETGKEKFLTDKECQILLILNQSLNQVVSKEHLLKEIWKFNEGIDTHTLETHIYRLRQKLDQFDGLKKKLVTEEEGYKLKA